MIFGSKREAAAIGGRNKGNCWRRVIERKRDCFREVGVSKSIIGKDLNFMRPFYQCRNIITRCPLAGLIYGSDIKSISRRIVETKQHRLDGKGGICYCNIKGLIAGSNGKIALRCR